MRIKVAFIDNDEGYLSKLKNKIRKDYSADLEAAYYTSVSDFVSDYKNNKANVAIINSELISEGYTGIPCPVVLLSEDNASGKMGNYSVVGKYQKFDELYRQDLFLRLLPVKK